MATEEFLNYHYISRGLLFSRTYGAYLLKFLLVKLSATWRKTGDTKATRAVANANGKNNIAIIVPCHRVIGSNKDLVGYAGGLWRKKWLLEHEAKVAHGVQTLF